MVRALLLLFKTRKSPLSLPSLVPRLGDRASRAEECAWRTSRRRWQGLPEPGRLGFAFSLILGGCTALRESWALPHYTESLEFVAIKSVSTTDLSIKTEPRIIPVN